MKTKYLAILLCAVFLGWWRSCLHAARGLAVYGRVSRLVLWRALGSLVERLGMLGLCGPGAGCTRGLDRG